MPWAAVSVVGSDMLARVASAGVVPVSRSRSGRRVPHDVGLVRARLLEAVEVRRQQLLGHLDGVRSRVRLGVVGRVGSSVGPVVVPSCRVLDRWPGVGSARASSSLAVHPVSSATTTAAGATWTNDNARRGSARTRPGCGDTSDVSDEDVPGDLEVDLDGAAAGRDDEPS